MMRIACLGKDDGDFEFSEQDRKDPVAYKALLDVWNGSSDALGRAPVNQAFAIACWRGHISIVKHILIYCHADPNVTVGAGWTVLLRAAIGKDEQILALLRGASGLDLTKVAPVGRWP